MTTSTWSSGHAHSTDAEFRAWGSELSTKLQAMTGLTKTSDTGQINWVTVARPGVNADGGYEVYYLNDSLHATAPIYFKIYYGTFAIASRPRLRIEVATGSNGSGTLTGTGSGTATSLTQDNGNGSSTPMPSYLCVTSGFVGLSWKDSQVPSGFFAIARTCDSSGVADAKGALIVTRHAAAGTTTCFTRSLRFESTAAAYPSGSYDPTYGLICPPMGITSTWQNGDNQAFVVWGAFPDIRPVATLCAVVAGAVSAGATFAAALIGATSRTFIRLTNATSGNPSAGSGNWSFAMLWE